MTQRRQLPVENGNDRSVESHDDVSGSVVTVHDPVIAGGSTPDQLGMDAVRERHVRAAAVMQLPVPALELSLQVVTRPTPVAEPDRIRVQAVQRSQDVGQVRGEAATRGR